MTASNATSDEEKPSEWTLALLERTVDRFSGWVQFGDAKAGGVLVLLGLGLTDLLDHAGRLVHAHRLRSDWGGVASTALWVALALAVCVIVEVSRALFPRVKSRTHSAFFFGSVAKYETGTTYAEMFGHLSHGQAVEQLAEQAWELSRIAARKFHRTRWSYWLVLAFLVAWAVGRGSLALA